MSKTEKNATQQSRLGKRFDDEHVALKAAATEHGRYAVVLRENLLRSGNKHYDVLVLGTDGMIVNGDWAILRTLKAEKKFEFWLAAAQEAEQAMAKLTTCKTATECEHETYIADSLWHGDEALLALRACVKCGAEFWTEIERAQ